MSNSSVSNNSTKSLTDRAKVRAYLALSRADRKSIPQMEFLDILRIWVRTISPAKRRIDSLSVDRLFNWAMGQAQTHIDQYLSGKRSKLTQYATIVAEYILDRETSELRSLDRKTLARLNFTYMYKDREYTQEECRAIHADMSEGQIMSEISRLRRVTLEIGLQLTPEVLAEITTTSEAYVREEFTLRDAFERKERLKL